MHLFAYLFPLVTTIVIFLQIGDYERYTYFLCVLAVAEALIGLAHWLIRYAGKSKEYLSGYVQSVYHYNDWTEMVVYYETIRMPNGQSKTIRRVRYVYHPEYWEWLLNTGNTSYISEGAYNYLCSVWNTPEHYVETFHANCVRGGGGQRHDWDGLKVHCRTVTYTGRYTNPLIHSNSIFHYKEVSSQEASELGLYDYPKIVEDEQNVVVGKDVDESVQIEFQYLNAINGLQHEIHVFVLLFDADKGVVVAEKQRAYWHGGNKNEFTVCIGVEGDEKLVRWCNAFSWMDEPTLEVATKGYFNNLIGSPLNLMDYANWLQAHIDLWKRKQFKDFKYIRHPMRAWQLVLMYLATGLVCYGIWWFIMNQTFY